MKPGGVTEALPFAVLEPATMLLLVLRLVGLAELRKRFGKQ